MPPNMLVHANTQTHQFESVSVRFKKKRIRMFGVVTIICQPKLTQSKCDKTDIIPECPTKQFNYSSICVQVGVCTICKWKRMRSTQPHILETFFSLDSTILYEFKQSETMK